MSIFVWLIILTIMVFAIIIIGGLTRLTNSGLSMVNWRPFLGTFPPLSEQEWSDVFNLYNAALAIIWVIIGGRGTLIGPVLGALILFYLTSFLGRQAVVNINLFLGLVLIVFVLVVPKGIVPSFVQLWDRRRSRRMTARSAQRMRRRGRSRVKEARVEE